MKIHFLLAFLAINCLVAKSVAAPAQTDAEIRKQLLGFWRSPRHEYEFKSDGVIYMLPAADGNTTSPWSVKQGHFYWDRDAYQIVSLTDKKFVYRSLAEKSSLADYVLLRITKAMVGKPYNRESVR